MNLTRKTKEIILHAAELDVERAMFIRKGLALVPKNICLDPETETLTMKFGENLPAGEAEISLAFRGVINDKLSGLYRSKYEVNGEMRYLAMTQLESTDARKVFPCVDEPEAKAVFDITVMSDKKHTIVSNTIPVETSKSEIDLPTGETGLQVVRFAPTPKMSSYLVAFLAGEFEFIEQRTKHGVLIRAFTTPGKRQQAEFALSVAVRALDFYTDYFAIPYPLPVLDLIAVPDFEAAAMENWGAVTYRESALLIDSENSSAENRQWVAVVVVHELAHQWFGNLVTMKWWTHLWLNEGFARFMEYLVLSKLFPEWDMWTQYLSDVQSMAFRLDALSATHPIEVEVNHPAEIGEIFDRVSYAKGATVIRMLWAYLGDEVFRDGLRYYLKLHAYGNAETNDLWRAMEKISGQPVRKIMRGWTEESGYPVLEIRENKHGLVWKQKRFLAMGGTPAGSFAWYLPVKIKIFGEDKPVYKLLSGQSGKIKMVAGNNWLKLNYGETGFYRVAYSEKMFLRLGEAVQRGELATADRLGVLRDAFALAEAGVISAELPLKISESYRQESDYTVWLVMAECFAGWSSLIYGTKAEKVFEEWTRGFFSPLVERLGFDSREGESHTQILLRELAILNAGNYGGKKVVAWAKKVFWSEGIISPNLRGAVYGIAARRGGRKEQMELIRRYKKADLHEEKDRIGRALMAVVSQNGARENWKFIFSENVRDQNAIHLLIGLLQNPATREFAWRELCKNWSVVVDKYGVGGLTLPRLVQELGSLTRRSAIGEVEKFFKKNPIGAVRSVSQAVEQIKINSNFCRESVTEIYDCLKRGK